jgi:hypothetical protein
MTNVSVVRRFWFAVVAGYVCAAAIIIARILTAGTWRTELSPLYAVINPRFSPWGLVAVLLFAGLLICLNRVLKSPPRPFVVFATLYGAALAMALSALWGGPANIPPRAVGIFLKDLEILGSPREFLPAFHHLITQISNHGHVRPPGIFVLLWVIVKLVGKNPYAVEAILMLLAAAAAVPIYALARRFLSREASALAVMLYLLSGNFATHGVSYDGVFATVGAAVIYLFIIVAQRGGWRDTIWAGVALAAGIVLSVTLAYLPVLGAFLLITYGLKERRPAGLVIRAVVVLAIPAVFFLALYLATGYDVAANFREAYRWAQTQASGGMNVFKLFFGRELPAGYPLPGFRRSYFLWVPGNLFALFFMAGVPTAVLYLWWAGGLLRRAARAKPFNAAFGAALVALLFFNLTGVTLGETERIWLYILPVITIPAALKLTEAAEAGASRTLIPAVLAVIFAQVLLARISLWIPW